MLPMEVVPEAAPRSMTKVMAFRVYEYIFPIDSIYLYYMRDGNICISLHGMQPIENMDSGPMPKCDELLRFRGAIPTLIFMEDQKDVYANQLIKNLALEFETVRAALDHLELIGLIRGVDTPRARVKKRYVLTKSGTIAAKHLKDCFVAISRLY